MSDLNQLNFPTGCQGKWLPADTFSVPEPRLKNWLLDTGSLTERLQASCRQFSVQLLGQQVAMATEDERQQIMSPLGDVVVREVILHGDQHPWVFARTLMPLALVEDGIDDLAHLGNKPLGQVIFNDHRFRRQPFQLCCWQAQDNLPVTLGLDSSHPIWGRRSVFSYQQFNMMVCEIFLPGSPAYSGLYSMSGRD